MLRTKLLVALTVGVLAFSTVSWAGTAYYRGSDTDSNNQITDAELTFTLQGSDFDIAYTGTAIDFTPGMPSQNWGLLVLPNGTGHNATYAFNVAQSFGLNDDFSMEMEITEATLTNGACFGIFVDVDDEPDFYMTVWDNDGTLEAATWSGSPLAFDRNNLPGTETPIGDLPWTLGIERVGNDVTCYFVDATTGRTDMDTYTAGNDIHYPRIFHDIGKINTGIGADFDVSVSEISITGGSGVLDIDETPPPPPVPTIEVDPTGAVLEGDTVTFTAPSGSTYAWQKDGTPIGGATAQTYVISSAVLADSGYYTCVIDSVEANGKNISVYPADTQLPVSGVIGLMAAGLLLAGLGVRRARK